MTTELKEPTQLVAGMTHREMVDIMQSNGVFCSVDKFARILIDAQRRAIAAMSETTKPVTRVYAPNGSGPCAKQTVTATLIAKNGDRYIGTNHCMNPQTVCPRSGMPTGVGYELCRSVCKQESHAEVNAIQLAGEAAKGASLRLAGHTYACESCKSVAREYGVAGIVIEETNDDPD